MIRADFYPTAQTYADGEIERTDIINNLYSNDVVGSPYYLGYIEHDDFPKSFGVSLVDYSQGMAFKRIESNHSWGYCFNKNVFNASGTSPSLFVVQDSSGHAENGGDRYCFLNKIKMAQQNFDRTVTYTAYIMYIPTSSIDDTDSAPFANYATSSISRTVTVAQLKDIIDGNANVLNTWTSSSVNYPDVKYSDFNEYGLALVQSVDSTMTAAICIAQVSISESGRYSYGNSSNVISAVFPFFEHDTEDKHIITSQGSGYSLNPKVLVYYDLGIIRPSTNFGMEYSGQFYTAQPFPYDVNMSDLPMPDSTYQTSVLVKGQYFLKWYSSATFSHINYDIFAHYDLKDVYTLMLYYHKIYTGTAIFSKSYSTDISVATFNDHDGATGNRLSDDYANISDQLRQWQQPDTDIAVNEYDPTTKPEYDPSGGDDGTDSGGDEIRPSDWTNIRIGAANNFVTLYGMTGATVADFGRQLWANLADPAFWQMVGTVFTNDFSINPADMMKYFISLRYFPFDVSDFAHTTATGIYVGRAASPIAPSTGVAYPIRITNNVVQVDGGRLTIRRLYNDFRDFEPCTTVQIHVPFCGSVDVPASEVMGHEMDLTYKIDLQTGAMLAVLGVASNTYYVIATLAGTCGASIPITANNNIEFLQRIATVGSGLIGGGVSGAVKGATVGGEVGAVVGAVAGTVGGGVGALAGLPPVTVHKQGNASGFANLGGVPYAYATVQRGRFERPANYGHTTGFACDFSATLGSLSGFTVCDNVDTSGLTCNADERDEIKRLLESGVYV